MPSLASARGTRFVTCSASLTTSNAQHLTGSTSSALREAGPSLLRPRLTSATTSMLLAKHLANRHRRRPLRVRRVTFLPYIRRIYNRLLRMTSGFESFGPLAQETTASSAVRGPQTGVCLLLPSDSTHGGHPCSSARSSCHQGLHRDSHRPVTSWVAFALQLSSHFRDASRHA